jgi:superfamily II DNA or RNA helicase/HKD family nuclease
MPSIKNVLAEKVIDNRQVSMVEAFEQLLPLSKHLDIAVGYFFLSGFASIEDKITNFFSNGGKMQILMGNVTNYITGTTVYEGYELKKTSDLLFNELKAVDGDVKKISLVQKLRQWVAEEKVEVKIYTGNANYFHAKSYLFYRQGMAHKFDGISIVGSSNFTKSGLSGNTELNSVSQDNFGALTKWFHEIWNSNEVSDFSKELLEFIDMEFPKPKQEIVYLNPKDSYLIFSRYFAKRLPQEIKGEFMSSLYRHQKIGVAEIKYRLDQFGTSILADGVGLGKTRTAAASICATEAKNVLILASKKLHDQWRFELSQVGVAEESYKLVSKEEIARHELQGLSEFMNQDLIIVDEAHQGLKNSRTKLYRNLSYIKERGEKQIKGLLLTATPWNNSRSDVFNLGRIFLNIKNIPSQTPYFSYLYHSPRKAAKAITNDDKAFKAFWKDLFLQRTKKTYGGNDVQYAERKFPVVKIQYEPQKEKAFLANGERISRLHLPYMNPIRYIQGANEEEFTADRMKMLFLKRADSSWKAFKDTLENVQRRLNTIYHDLNNINNNKDVLKNFKAWLRHNYQLTAKDQYEGIFDMEEDEISDTLELEKRSIENKEKYQKRLEEKIQSITIGKAEDMLFFMLKHALEDLEILEQIILDLDMAFNRKDEKYEKVRDTLLEYLQKGEKVLLISQFRATVIDYYKRLMNEESFQVYKLAQVTGHAEDWYIGNVLQGSKEIILERFSPRSKQRPDLVGTEEEVQLVIGTETLSVGQNLQDSRVLMNLDLPYNPMNLEQRIGRIDRPREEDLQGEISVLTFPSIPVIESELKLSERLKQKLEGIYQDTKFDDLVLPEYRDFLQKVLKQRAIEQGDIEQLMNNTIRSTIVDFAAEEHSAEYVEAQIRMRNAIEEDIPVNYKVKVKDCSFSSTDCHTIIASVTLKDVNGVKIDDYLMHLTQNNSFLSTDIVKVENSWYKATKAPILYESELIVHAAEERLKDIKEYLKSQVLSSEVNKYNKRLSVEEEIDNNLVDNKVKKVIVEINDQIRGRNKKSIVSKIASSGYDPRTVQTLKRHLQYIDRRYDSGEMDLIDELYQNINRLWDNYGYYYELLVQEEQMQFQEETFHRSIRAANFEMSKIDWVIGNLGIL